MSHSAIIFNQEVIVALKCKQCGASFCQLVKHWPLAMEEPSSEYSFHQVYKGHLKLAE